LDENLAQNSSIACCGVCCFGRRLGPIVGPESLDVVVEPDSEGEVLAASSLKSAILKYYQLLSVDRSCLKWYVFVEPASFKRAVSCWPSLGY
jgi:hypothetical protein